jgi:hypothetical protein
MSQGAIKEALMKRGHEYNKSNIGVTLHNLVGKSEVVRAGETRSFEYSLAGKAAAPTTEAAAEPTVEQAPSAV